MLYSGVWCNGSASHAGLCDGSGDNLNSGVNDRQLRTPEEYMAAGHCNLVLAYPAGFDGSSGCINIIRGSHLYSDTSVDNSNDGLGNTRGLEEVSAQTIPLIYPGYILIHP